MANFIKCPVCGKNSLSDQEFCQYCQARLQPLTGNLKGADAPLTPGQLPTKKSTADLEPILPQWLRDARSSARQTSEEEADQAAQQPQTFRSTSSATDMLAGLQSQAQDNDEEDVPDWLTNITGETPKTKKAQPESSQPAPPADVRWVELGDKKDFAQSEIPSDTPDWLAGITPSTPQFGEKDELTDWNRGAGDSQKPQSSAQPFSFDVPVSDEAQDWLHSMSTDGGGFNDSENNVDESPISSDAPDWLRAMDAGNAAPSNSSSTPPASDDAPDWLRAMDAGNAAPSNSSNTPPASDDAPDWLRAMDAGSSASSNSSSTPPASSDVPDWLRAMDAGNAAPSNSSNTPPISSDVPDWLHTLSAEEKPQSIDPAGLSESGLGKLGAELPSAGDTPDWLKGLESNQSSSDQDWLKGLGAGEAEQPAQDSAPAWLSAAQPLEPEKAPAAPEQDELSSDIPSWLKSAAPQSSIYDEPVVEQKTPEPVSPSSDTPDWLNTFKTVETPEPASAFSMEAPAASAPPDFADKAQPNANADSLFTEMPDWLSIVDETVSPESMPAPITNVDAIAPGDLPSWVQAMRPVDSGIPQNASTSLSGDKKLESRGALAGLQGVLPAATGFAPTSKPKAYSIKMKASDEQQTHAALLEQILEAETAPVSIGSFSALGTSRALRWLLAFLFFAILTSVVFAQKQIFLMPVGNPAGVDSALSLTQSIPEGSQVLVVFDYEPARVGEMETAAVPMFRQMKRQHLTLISTNETGAILAERFMSEYFTDRYIVGDNYLNLGYLPGGSMGIRALAENPSVTAPYALAKNLILFDPTLSPAWELPPLSQMAAVIIITDNADSVRAWVEQTTSARGATPFVVISSAQSAPMIEPYYDSRQINGLVSGLYGGALIEKIAESGPVENRSTTARAYWDAYNIGLLLAAALMLGGGLLNLALGLRDRAAARDAQ